MRWIMKVKHMESITRDECKYIREKFENEYPMYFIVLCGCLKTYDLEFEFIEVPNPLT